ncbi:Fatty acid desaturase family protein [Aphelenchoides avenae]|nr:Fatty acid desaturase family protein [Aphelenchus avenae]
MPQSVEEKKYPTIEELRSVVPPECFEKSELSGFFHLGWNAGAVVLLYYAVPYFEHYGWPGLAVWYFIVGMFGAGLFTLGHDCMHNLFSDNVWINDTVGHIINAPMLMPFWPLCRSHFLHHMHTNHVTKDAHHPWIVDVDWKEAHWAFRGLLRLPLVNFIKWHILYQLIGMNDGSHYWPWSKLFPTTKDRIQCAFSTAACVLAAAGAYVLCDYDLHTWFKYYIMAVVCQSYWLCLFTILNHQDDDTEVFEDDTWTYVKGALQTRDRVFGYGVDFILHHEVDCHVIHHLFPWKIPHYHLPKASAAMRKLLDEKYPGVYKRHEGSWIPFYFHYEFLRLHFKLEYLIGKGTGLLKFAGQESEHAKAA